ncbi:prohibitin family protein [Blautia obeum]|uniref:Prohibitin family protein n=1 Tax=Blautia obeum TaxID=40520 RepID=A0A414SKH8_9FIRM|nr:prohibitin family protein [Blautia obeum]RHG20100.1 prohibitin family protein [Blautia obeum]
MKRGKLGGIVLGVFIVVVLICLWKCSVRVPTGYKAVTYHLNGGISKDTLDEGWHIVPPTVVKTSLYSIGIEQSYLTSEDKGDSPKDESFKTPTADGKSLLVNLEFSYMFDQDRITTVFKKFKGQSGETVKNTFIKPKMKAWTQEVTAKYPVTDVFGDKRQELNEALDTYLKQKFDPYGIIIDTVNFTSISTDDETQAAIQKKVNAQQELELANIEAKTAKVQADKDKEVALITAEQDKEKAAIQAEQAKIDAEGKAEAVKIKAQAEAEANKEIAESLTPELIEKQKIDKWNGEVPKIQGSDTSTIVDTRDMTEPTEE